MKRILLIIASIGLINLLLTCQKLDIEPITKIETISAIPGSDYVQAHCKILDLSKSDHFIFGFCYSTNAVPTVNDSKVIIGKPELGDFSYKITGLASNTRYYIRAYCKEGSSYLYGEIIDVKTTLVNITVTDIDNNTYKVITIGNQVWMQENLKVTHYRNGTEIQLVNNNSWTTLTSGAYCWYGGEIANKNIYGVLYNFYAVVDSRNLCPTGWHIPTYAEWTTLIDFLGGEAVAGGKMKEFGTTHWDSPNTGATNSSGFTGLPGGYRNSIGIFDEIQTVGKWWSSTGYDGTKARYCYLYYLDASITRDNIEKIDGVSVRCIRDN